MSISSDCEVTIEALGDWEEVDEETEGQERKTREEAERAFREIDDTFILCKHHHHKHKYTKANMSDSSIFSLIMGVAMVVMGVALAPVSPGSSAALIAAGSALATNAFSKEVDASFDKKKEEPPATPADTGPRTPKTDGVLV